MNQISKEKSRRKRITWKQIVAFVMLITMFFTQQGMMEVFAAEDTLLEQKSLSENNITVTDEESTDMMEQNKDNENRLENEESKEGAEIEDIEAKDTEAESEMRFAFCNNCDSFA